MPLYRLFAYAFPAFALAMPTIPIYIYLPSFYATEVGIGLTVVGAVLLGSRIFDTVTDPVIGYVSDRLDWRWGRRKPLILIGGIIAGVAMLLLAHPSDGAGAMYLLSASLVLYLGWTMIAVPYTAWGAELVSGYDQRSRVTAARESLMLIGILAAAAIPVALGVSDGGGSETEGLQAIAWAAVLVGIPAFALLAFIVPDPQPVKRVQTIPRVPVREAIATIIANKPFLRLFAAWFVNGLANGFPAVLFLLYMEHALGIGEGERPQYMLAYFLPGVLGVPIWIWLSQRYNKHRVWCLAMIIASMAFATVPFLTPELAWVFMIVCVITGATLGADLALPPAIQADVVDYDRLKSKRDRTGIYFALWGMATKLALALAVGIAFPFLDFAGFDPGAAVPNAIWALVVIYALVPVVLKVLSVAIVAKFPIGRRKHDVIRRRLATMRM